MTQTEQSISSYSTRMKTTFTFATAPLNLLIALFSVSDKREEGALIRGIAVFFGLLFSPVLLLATPVTLVMGIIAGIAQTAYFPFQLFFAIVKDATAPSNPGGEITPPEDVSEASYTEHYSGHDIEKHASTHFDSLFSNKRSTGEMSAPVLVQDEHSFKPQ
ncbi:hypothetical protein [uncultured Legionella sp.]|uniref:hypothetical protein n=1 Tax=uncultured Legionella sp. TaxID=210934 RepID=UPI002607DCBA|nr:hypothetical protein [uncultured Legionella sp.]